MAISTFEMNTLEFVKLQNSMRKIKALVLLTRVIVILEISILKFVKSIFLIKTVNFGI